MSEPFHSLAAKKTGASFTASEVRDALVKKGLEADRLAFEAKTAKLRALRLAKEAADAQVALKLAADAKPALKRKSKPS
jgi:hypothetical protein